MFKPNLRLTGKLLTNIAQIERFYGQLESFHIPKKLELNLERDNLIQSSYISNSIEGNPLSLPEVTNLLLGERLPTNRDEKEVRNYFDLLKHLQAEIGQPLNVDYLLSLQQRLLRGVNDDIAGQIRNQRIVVGHYQRQSGIKKLVVKHEPPSHQDVDIRNALQALFHWLSNQPKLPAVIQAGIFHHQFVSSQFGLRKSSSRFYALIFRSCKLVPKDTVWIDDREKNLLIPKARGVQTILYKNESQLIRALNMHV